MFITVLILSNCITTLMFVTFLKIIVALMLKICTFTSGLTIYNLLELNAVMLKIYKFISGLNIYSLFKYSPTAVMLTIVYQIS